MTTKEIARAESSRDFTIAMANKVIDEMRMGLSAQQQNILDFMLKEINADDNPNKEYRISIQSYCVANNIEYRKNGSNYKDIKAGIKEINNNTKWITTEDGKHDVLITWFKNVVIDRETGIIRYNIDDTMRPYLFGLIETGHYTSYQYRATASMDSKYAKTLYRILMRYIKTKIEEPLITIEKLKKQLDAEKYSTYKDFRVCVLDIAVREINRTTLLKVEYEPHKKVGSRAYTHIAFHLSGYLGNDEEIYRIRESNMKFGEELYGIGYTEEDMRILMKLADLKEKGLLEAAGADFSDFSPEDESK